MSLPRDIKSASGPSATRYRALCPLAVPSVVVGVLSILTVFSWYLALVPLLGIGLGWQVQRRIRQAPDECTGLGLARLGMGLSVGFWILGYGWLIFAGVRDVPYGYDLISYDTLQPDPNVPTQLVPEAALDMQDKKVFIKGYMQPRRRQTGIKEFILCPSNGECPFCITDPKRTEMIRVVLQGNLKAFYTTRLIGVGGRFQVDSDSLSGTPYTLEADYLRN